MMDPLAAVQLDRFTFKALDRDELNSSSRNILWKAISGPEGFRHRWLPAGDYTGTPVAIR